MNFAAVGWNVVKKAGLRRCLIVIFTVGFILFQGYLAFIRPLHPLLQSPLHWVFGLIVAFLYYPIYKRPEGAEWGRKDCLVIIDILLILGLLFCAYYFVSQSGRLINRFAYLDPIYPVDFVTGFLTILIVLEATRRVLGWNLVIFVFIFMVYLWMGPYLPGILRHRGTNLARFTEIMVIGTDGIFGLPLAVSVSFMFHFIIFGAMFADMGGGNLLTDIGFSVSKGAAGGPAKAAVVASSLFGTVSGSTTANVMATGVVTIPMMKRAGYPAHEAGAIEAVASTGGQIMPPIMGVAAFIMAEILGVTYLSVCIAATIPAVIYFLSIFILVTFLAKRNQARQVTLSINIPPILPRLFLLLPMFVLMYCIISGYSMQRSAMLAMATVLLLNPFRGKNRARARDIFESVMRGIKNLSSVIIPTSVIGIVIGSVTSTGLANRMASALEVLGSSYLVIALLFAMVGCLLLGMALPTVAAYLTANILFGMPLMRLGLSPLIANLFLFYFGIFAHITPPVCLGSFAAAGLAGANSWKTGFTAFFYCTVGFLIPYVFVFNPNLLLGISTNYLETAYLIAVLSCGTVFLCTAISGWLFIPLRMYERFIMGAAAIGTIVPERLSTISGLIVGLVFIIICYSRKKWSGKNVPGDPSPA